MADYECNCDLCRGVAEPPEPERPACVDCGDEEVVVGFGNPPEDLCQACFEKRLAKWLLARLRLRQLFQPEEGES